MLARLCIRNYRDLNVQDRGYTRPMTNLKHLTEQKMQNTILAMAKAQLHLADARGIVHTDLGQYPYGAARD